MDLFSHISHLEQVSYFNAGLYALPITPYTIPRGKEVVEVITGGKIFFEHEGKQMTLGRGAIFWHIEEEHTIWDTPAESPYKCACFRFGVTQKKRLLPRLFFWRGSDAGLNDFFQFSRNWHKAAPGDPRLFAYCLSTLTAHASAPEDAGAKSRRALSSLSETDPLMKVLRRIEEFPAAPPDIGELCALSGINRNRLFKEFRSRFGLTPHAFITHKRIEKARNLLENSLLPIKEIADSCGFANIEVFYRTFHHLTGVTPKECRDACRSYNLIR